MFSIVPKDDRHQALRARRSVIAISGYAVLACCSLAMGYLGFARGIGFWGMACLWAVLLLVSAVPLLLIVTGVNRLFKDPSLTIFQISLGILFVTIMGYFTVSGIRGVITVVYILVFVFGAFRLRMRDFLPLVAFAVLMYVGAMLVLHRFHPGAVDVNLEVMRTVILLLALLWISFLASYIANLRRRVKHMASYDALTNIYNRREIFGIPEQYTVFVVYLGYRWF